METVEGSSKNIEVAIMEKGTGLRVLSDEAVDAVVAAIEEEKAKEAAKKSTGGQQPTA
jgi:20S proteasome subunit alpha 4